MELDKRCTNLFCVSFVSKQLTEGKAVGSSILMEATPTSSVRSTIEIRYSHHLYESISDGNKK